MSLQEFGEDGADGDDDDDVYTEAATVVLSAEHVQSVHCLFRPTPVCSDARCNLSFHLELLKFSGFPLGTSLFRWSSKHTPVSYFPIFPPLFIHFERNVGGIFNIGVLCECSKLS